MNQGLILLHCDLVLASRNFLALWQAASPVPGEVITDQATAAALVPAFPGFPTVAYEDATGERHCLFNPPDVAAVMAWREGVDNPPAVTTMTPLVFSERFTQAERIAVRAMAKTDGEVEDAWELFQTAQEIDLANALCQSGIAILVSKGLLTQARADAILGVTS